MSWLRDHMKIIMWVTAGIFILAFVGGQAIRYFAGPQRPSRTVATINGEAVPINTYQNFYQQLRDQQQKQGSEPLQSSELQKLRQRAFTQLVNQKLMQQAIRREGGKATSSEIRQTVLSQRLFKNQSGQVNRRRAARFLQQLPKHRRKQLVQTQRRKIETFRLTQWLGSQVSLTDNELHVVLREGLKEVKLYGLYINPERYVSSKKVQSYYNQNKDNFAQPPRAYVRHILLKPDPDTAPSEQARLRSIKQTVETIRRRYRAGDEVTQLAREYSEDTATASRGGLMGWVRPDDVPQSLASEIFDGADTRTLSNLVKTDRGYHLVYVEKGPVSDYKPLSDAEPQIRKKLLSDTHWNRAKRRINQLHADLKKSDSPFSSLQEKALLHSHSDFASSRRGYYGWVPVRYVVEAPYAHAEEWEGELTSNNLVLNSISNLLTSLEPSRVSKPVKHQFGYHLFYVQKKKDAKLNTLSDTQTRALRTRLRSTQKTDFVQLWLRRQRQRATIKLQVPPQRVGGKISWVDASS